MTADYNLDLPDADILYFPEFLSVSEHGSFLCDVDDTTIWRQENIHMYGKDIPIPRLTAWYGDEDSTYTYSGITLKPRPWTETLLELRTLVENTSEASFNSVLLNLYRDGKDSVAWHSDDEPELGAHPIIASLSLGGVRKFQLKHKTKPIKHELQLLPGSLLVMRGSTQTHWLHQIPKTTKPVDPRINLTFRHLG